MPDVKKEQEREELHRAIWAIADELPGSMDGWDCKKLRAGHDVLSLHQRKPNHIH